MKSDFDQGVAAHRQGSLKQAQRIYEEVLKAQPAHFNALHLLGVVHAQTASPQTAMALFDRAIALMPDEPNCHLNRAKACMTLKRFSDALTSLDKVIDGGMVSADVWHRKGLVLEALGRAAEAVQCYERAIALAPDDAQAHFKRADILQAQGQLQAAVDGYNQVIRCDPRHATAYCHRGNVQHALGQLDEAVSSFDRAIEIDPGFALAYSNRGVVLQERGELQSALLSLDAAIALDPGSAQSHYNRGMVQDALDQTHAALASMDTAIALDSGNAPAYFKRAIILNELSQHDAAFEAYAQAIAARPDYAEAHFNKALMHLTHGDFAAGWAEFEWRWKLDGALSLAKPFAQPSWLGDEPLSGKTIFVHHEQGMGDTLQFCRYATLAAQAGARVVLAVPKPLAALLRGQEVVSAVIEPGAFLPAFDLHCPMMSLPLAFKTTLETIPFADRYLTADEEMRAYWDQTLGARTRPRVGLVWNGGFRANQPELWAVNERRNMPVHHLAALKGLDCQFISLQKGDPAESEFKQLQQQGWDGPDILNRVDELKDFSDTAALIAALDLVIAVDTSVAHLAGALGKPVWLLNRFDSCWRWLIDRQDSPWYQSMRIFNQKSPGDWDGVMKAVVAALSISANDHLKKS